MKNIIEKIKGLSLVNKSILGLVTLIVVGSGIFGGYILLNQNQEENKPTISTKQVEDKKEEVKKVEEEVAKAQEEVKKVEEEVQKVEEEKQQLETQLANETNEEKKEEIRKQIEEKARVVETKKEEVKKVAVVVETKKQEVVKKQEEVKKVETAVATNNSNNTTTTNNTPSQPEKPKDVVTTKEVVENGVTESIPFSTETKQDATLEKGKTRVEREGQNGQKVEKIIYTVTYKNGSQTSKEVKTRNWETTVQPVNKVVVEGTKVVVAKKQPHFNRALALEAGNKINELRQKHGLPKAQIKLDENAAKNQKGIRQHFQGLLGEVLTFHRESGVEAVMAWYNSAGHRDNILGNYKNMYISTWTTYDDWDDAYTDFVAYFGN